MPAQKGDQFVDAVKPALESLLSDLEKTTEVLRRKGKRTDDNWESTNSLSFHGKGDRTSYGSGGTAATRNSGNIDSMATSVPTDYQTIPKGDCAACGDAVVGPVVIALGQMWHPDHYTCCHCGDVIADKNFFEKDGKAYCENDYHDLYSPRCAYCNGPIKERCVTALGKTFHPEHFVCSQCGKEFGEEGFHEKDGYALCKDDFYQMYAPKCKGCGKAITAKYITALGTHWHPECFVCNECGSSVSGVSYLDDEGIPLCEAHFNMKNGSRCYHCEGSIFGRCVTAMGRKFHPEHFVCAYCCRQLSRGTFKECANRPYCQKCFDIIR